MDYSNEEHFNDPIIRCCDCQTMMRREAIREFGMCANCGARRFRNVLSMTEKEMAALAAEGIDPEFLALFEGRSSAGATIDVN